MIELAMMIWLKLDDLTFLSHTPDGARNDVIDTAILEQREQTVKFRKIYIQNEKKLKSTIRMKIGDRTSH